jgi:hypothetical protein
MPLYKIVCHTTGCPNENIDIEFYTPAENILCHPCNTLFTDITIIGPGENDEL